MFIQIVHFCNTKDLINLHTEHPSLYLIVAGFDLSQIVSQIITDSVLKECSHQHLNINKVSKDCMLN